jgi:hypothetical protein
MVNVDKTSDVYIFQYQHSVIVHATENMRALSLNYIAKEEKSIANTFEQIKMNLVKRFKDLPQPAAFLIMSKFSFPMMETIIPVTKRLMLTRVLI